MFSQFKFVSVYKISFFYHKIINQYAFNVPDHVTSKTFLMKR